MLIGSCANWEDFKLLGTKTSGSMHGLQALRAWGQGYIGLNQIEADDVSTNQTGPHDG